MKGTYSPVILHPKNHYLVMMDFEKTPEKTMVKTIFPIEKWRKKLEGREWLQFTELIHLKKI